MANSLLMLMLISLNALASIELKSGILFTCNKSSELSVLENKLSKYFQELKIKDNFYEKQTNDNSKQLLLTLKTPINDTNTLDLNSRKEYEVTNEDVNLISPFHFTIKFKTVSRKEIILALMQHGRVTEFKNEHCNFEDFKENVEVRQNTVAWASQLEWGWPNGGSAYWNKSYWDRGTPLNANEVTEAFMDAFLNQDAYGIGCYTATKIVMTQGILDYYSRVNPNPKKLRTVIDRLYRDGDPLVTIEPRKMWSFELDFDFSEINVEGKLLTMIDHVAPKNFVPGDWAYLLNQDPESMNKTGYEGSNAIYLGGNRFDDYYNDNDYSYTYEEKIDEVYQWRNGVFSRSRDYLKIKKLTNEEMSKLDHTPSEGGLVLATRTFHYLF